MTDDILKLLEERRQNKNNIELYKQIQRSIDIKMTGTKHKWQIELCKEFFQPRIKM